MRRTLALGEAQRRTLQGRCGCFMRTHVNRSFLLSSVKLIDPARFPFDVWGVFRQSGNDSPRTCRARTGPSPGGADDEAAEFRSRWQNRKWQSVVQLGRGVWTKRNDACCVVRSAHMPFFSCIDAGRYAYYAALPHDSSAARCYELDEAKMMMHASQI